jgi:hypothetical protein
MWSIVFLVLFFVQDKRIILASILIAGIVQGVESYFDYKVKIGYQDVLAKSGINANDLLKKVIYPVEDMSLDSANSQESED